MTRTRRGIARRGAVRVVAGVAFVLAVALGLHGAADRWIAATVLPPLASDTSVEMRAADGTLLRAFTVEDGRWRLALDPTEVDPAFIDALLAYEDRRFHRHGGVDALALGRAALQMLRHGRVVSGGSTLTMQVARLIEGGPTGSWAGKLRQIRVALALERRLDKAAILALYLHRAPYGGNIEGLRAATLTWLGKEPRRLTPAERALMIALPQAPAARRPDRDEAAARAARARVLARMVRAGLIDADGLDAALREPVPTQRRPMPALAPHLADRLRAAAPGVGLHVTTLDARLQHELERLAGDAVAGRDPRLSAAILVADHRTGAILASVGSPDHADTPREGFVDMTVARRSPGSTLKPLIYGLAFDQGLAHPETLIEDAPVAFGTYRPQNFDGRFRGTVRVRQALQMSLNTPVVQLTDALGPARVMAGLRRAGAAPEVPGGRAGLAVALGGLGLSLGDLVQVYAAIADGGRARPLAPLPGTRLAGPRAQVLSAVAAWQVGDILSGIAPPPGAPDIRLAYKTGTSYGHRDALAVGYDGAHVAGVWLGRADGTPVPGAFGGELAAPILFEVFARLKPAPDPLPPPPAAALTVSTAALPPPLRRFRPPGALFTAEESGPAIAFPPEGARVEPVDGAVMVRVDRGTPPFTWLANGRPAAATAPDRTRLIPAPGAGFSTLTVIDAEGRAARVTIRQQ